MINKLPPLAGPVDASGEPLVSSEEIEHMKRDSHFDPIRERLRGQVRALRRLATRIDGYLSSPAQCSVEAWTRFQDALRAAAVPSSPAQGSILVDRDADVRREMRAYLDTLTIHGDNIGDIRRSLFVPYPSQWNGWVREDTAARELPAPSPSAGAAQQKTTETKL